MSTTETEQSTLTGDLTHDTNCQCDPCLRERYADTNDKRGEPCALCGDILTEKWNKHLPRCPDRLSVFEERETA